MNLLKLHGIVVCCQMNDAVEPSRGARTLAGILSIIQIILLGPLTLISALSSSLVCCGCVIIQISATEQGMTWAGAQTYFSVCITAWGVFWMCVLFFLPLVFAAGGVAVGVIAALAILTYPCYAAHR